MIDRPWAFIVGGISPSSYTKQQPFWRPTLPPAAAITAHKAIVRWPSSSHLLPKLVWAAHCPLCSWYIYFKKKLAFVLLLRWCKSQDFLPSNCRGHFSQLSFMPQMGMHPSLAINFDNHDGFDHLEVTMLPSMQQQVYILHHWISTGLPYFHELTYYVSFLHNYAMIFHGLTVVCRHSIIPGLLTHHDIGFSYFLLGSGHVVHWY